MDILVIGNGFDLAHGLKTSYKDFLDYCQERNSKRFIGAVNYGTTFIDNIWLRHFIIRNQKLGNTWIDIEQEIYYIIKTVSKAIYNLSNGEMESIFPIIFSVQKDIIDFDFNNICDYLKTSYYNYETNGEEYINIEPNDFSRLYTYIKNYHGFITFLYDKLREFTKEFENYLENNVLKELPEESKYQLSLQPIGVQPKDKDVYVLSFNYTNTCEKLYKNKFNTYCNLRIKPIYIHGKVFNSKDCNLVMGTHSFSNERTSSNTNPIPVDFNIFKKHNQRHRYETIEAYQDFLKVLTDHQRIIKPVFHVVGHSLDKTDHNILKHVFLINKNSTIKIYYHNEEAQERLINNITNIIGEEEVMTRVQFIHQHDKKRGILIQKTNILSQNTESIQTV